MTSPDVAHADDPIMAGFDERYPDPPAYILGVTKEIWEDRGIDTLHASYTDDIPVRSPSGVVRGNRAVINATMATLAEFPDRTLLGEDVIWSPDPDGGFLSSHRILSTATHAAPGVYGAPTGRTLRYRIIADCAARAGSIHDEWLIRDQGAIVRQLDLDPKAYAAAQIAAEGGPESAARPFTPAVDVAGPYRGVGNDDERGAAHVAVMETMMGGGLSAVRAAYDRAVQCEYPGGVTEHGRGAVDTFWLGLRSSFPDARFDVHHVIGREDPGLGARVALRWSLDGSHDGWGTFGRPTGAPVHVMGLTHVDLGPWGVRREFVLFDETAIWKQILLHTG